MRLFTHSRPLPEMWETILVLMSTNVNFDILGDSEGSTNVVKKLQTLPSESLVSPSVTVGDFRRLQVAVWMCVAEFLDKAVASSQVPSSRRSVDVSAIYTGQEFDEPLPEPPESLVNVTRRYKNGKCIKKSSDPLPGTHVVMIRVVPYDGAKRLGNRKKWMATSRHVEFVLNNVAQPEVYKDVRRLIRHAEDITANGLNYTGAVECPDLLSKYKGKWLVQSYLTD